MSKYSSRDLLVTITNNAINRTISSLHISANIIKTLAGLPNTAEIVIYNLNENSREDLSKNVYDFTQDIGITKIQVILDDNVLFSGDLINVNSIQKQNEGEWITTLYCGDGFNAYRASVTNKKYAKGNTRKEIVNDLLDGLEEAGLATKGLIGDLKGCTDKSLLKSITINGEVMKNIKGLLENCLGGSTDAEDVYIDEGKVNIIKKGDVVPNNNIIVNKQLLEIPTLTEQGINCKTVLQPSLKIGAEFQVETKSFNATFGNLTKNRVQKSRISGTGIYKLQEVRHIVDNFSDDVATSEIIGINTRIVKDS